MKYGTLSLWFAYPGEAVTQEAARNCMEMLSAEERARLESIRPVNVRQEYLIAHTLVRRALSCASSTLPESWQFRTNPYGKPKTDPDCGLRFNLSHSRELAVCLVSQGFEVGIDTEHVKRASEILTIAEDVFSPLELAQLEDLGKDERLDRALSLWVLKEAYVKARGTGLSTPLKSFSMVFDGKERIRLQHHPPDESIENRWRFCLLDHHEHRIALFAEASADPTLELWELRPVLDDPTQLAACELTWFPLARASS